MQSTRTQRTNADALESLAAERTVEAQRHRAITRSTHRQQEADRTTLEPASGELQHPSRGTVEPLDVVDRDNHRGQRGERPKTATAAVATAR